MTMAQKKKEKVFFLKKKNNSSLKPQIRWEMNLECAFETSLETFFSQWKLKMCGFHIRATI